MKQGKLLQLPGGVLAALATMCVGLMASQVVEYDPRSVGVTNRVVRFERSADTLEWVNRSNVVINPSVPTNGLPMTWKVTVGGGATNVVEMSAEDLSAIAAARVADETSVQQARERAAKTNAAARLDVFDREEMRLLRAFAEATRGEINILRGQLQLARTNATAFASATNRSAVALGDRTAQQMITAIKNELNAQSETAP